MYVHRLYYGSVKGAYECYGIALYGYWTCTCIYLLLFPKYASMTVEMGALCILLTGIGAC